MSTTSSSKETITTWLLTGDIGGTNSRMSLYDARTENEILVITYRNQDYLKQKLDGIFEQNIIAPFIKKGFEQQQEKSGNTLSLKNLNIVACLAIAGPVSNNSVWMSNLHNIIIDGTAIENQTYNSNNDPFLKRIIKCKIINDFVAQGYGCLTLVEGEYIQLNPKNVSNKDQLPKVNPHGPKVCVGAGTGLGECYLTSSSSDGSYTCYPSEGGHVEYAPRNDGVELKLWTYLRQKFKSKNRISVERVVSGPGLANCYEFLTTEYPNKVNQSVLNEFNNAGDLKGKVVAINASKGKEDGGLCYDAMNIMMTTYGSEVGSTAIKFIPTGGLFVTGGLTPKNIKFIQPNDSPFLQGYYDKGRVTPILDSVPLFAVLVEDLGIRGAKHNAKMVRIMCCVCV